MSFWTSALQVAAKQDRMKKAETKLLQLARDFGGRRSYEYKITTFDTNIPRKVIPLKQKHKNEEEEEEDFIIHAVHVESKSYKTKTPLVLLHGYMNAAAYFYRNLVGLSSYFENIYSLDMLGWGLSSRPDFDLLTTTEKDSSVDEVSAAEAFFVESLEAWREKNNIEKMILAGHSMGGYMSVAYCEKYPQHVERLILLSPVGVPEETPDIIERRQAMTDNSWRVWALTGVAQNIFQNQSAGIVFRGMPTSWGENMFLKYVQKRLPAISDPEEQEAISEYLVANNQLPGSGEHAINKVLNPYAYAKRPTEFRIPQLDVKSVTFLYGDHDWMDPRGGTVVDLKCQARRSQRLHPTPEEISVYKIRNAGHLLMLENWQEFNEALIVGAGGSLDCLPEGSYAEMPEKLDASNFIHQETPSSSDMKNFSTSKASQQDPSLKQQGRPQRSRTSSLSDASTSTSSEPQISG